ncbi:arylamine N-acetyltransferase, partial [Neobacillus drentensis]
EFRVDRVESEHGDYIMYMKLNRKDEDWKIGYAFNSKEEVQNITELNEVKRIIIEHRFGKTQTCKTSTYKRISVVTNKSIYP